jgi:cholesterol transport system auxiliary component
MTAIRPLLRLGALTLAAAALAGCISLLPKTKPAQLYRFGDVAAAPADAAGARPAQRIGVFSGNGDFPREAAGDRILTITGGRAAYIAQSRWVSDAQVLWEQAVDKAFEARATRVRLAPRGAPQPTDYVLRLDVRSFEARYDEGPKAAPNVVVRVHATLTRDRARVVVADQIFEADVRASDNRVSAIAAAFDKAVGQVLGEIVPWTDAGAR